MQLSDPGLIVAETWDTLPSRFPTIELDAFVIMPNHVHGIIVLNDSQSCPTSPDDAGVRVGQALPGSTESDDKKAGTPWGAPTLGDVVGAFKSLAAIACNRASGRSGIPFWQRNYYEHIVRDDTKLAHIRDYIVNNPARWGEDRYYTEIMQGRIAIRPRQRFTTRNSARIKSSRWGGIRQTPAAARHRSRPT